MKKNKWSAALDFNPCMKHQLIRKSENIPFIWSQRCHSAYRSLNRRPFYHCRQQNPNATMMKMAAIAIVADANQVCLGIIKAIKEKVRE